MNQRPNAAKGPLPLVVGVTGHRDLAGDAIPKIAEEVRRLFASLSERYPSTPIVLLSSLAEGADRLVALTALDCGAKLCAVLPMAVDVYEGDFQSPHSLEEFRRLLTESYDAIVVQNAGDDGDKNVESPGPARDSRYANAGAFIVRHSQVLIALWDGNLDEMLGGTSQIVRFALRGVPAHYLSGRRDALHTDETGAVYHIRSVRDVAAGESCPAVTTSVSARWLYPQADASEEGGAVAARRAFEESLRSLDRFNHDALTVPVDRQAAKSADMLLPSAAATRLNLEPSILSYTRSLFGKADALALRCRNLTHAVMMALFGVIWIAIAVFSFYSNLYTEAGILYAVFFALVVFAFGLDLAETRSRLQDRFQDYRALAEGLRVQFYWRLAGIAESVYDHYLARQEGELDWIRNAMRAPTFQPQSDPGAQLKKVDQPALLEIILSQWVRGEATYFAGAMQKERVMASRIKWSATSCLLLTGAVAIALAGVLAAGATGYRDALITLLELALVSAGLLTGYAQKRAHEEHARRYHRMWLLYRIAADRIRLCLEESNLPAARSVLVHLGREALAETCDWLLLHRERQIDVPTG